MSKSLVHEIGAKLACRKGISMLTGLKMPSLACKRAFLQTRT